MKPFMDKDFLLSTETARKLYHECAAKTPILDYHCHVDPAQIRWDDTFKNIAQVWLGGDHYKWRQMRSCGVEERFITGDATDREKFRAFARIMPQLIGNPMYHWSHLELRQYFGCDLIICEENTDAIWDACAEKLQHTSVRKLIADSGVKLLCTTDDPVDSLEHHRALAEDDSFAVQVLPAWRPEAAMQIDSPDFVPYLERLGRVAGSKIDSFATLKAALKQRMAFFAETGCRTSDHSLDYMMYYPASEEEVERIFALALAGKPVSTEQKYQYLTAFMCFAAAEYHKLGWVMQIHFGVIRNCNTPMYRKLGANTGFDSVSNYTSATQAAGLLDAMETAGSLPKTVLYSLNPGDFTTMGALIGCYQTGEIPGKLQLGSGWWFHDTKTGMTEQLVSLANQGALGTFIGMLTDSRSFISYSRHEYFRRILCELVGGWVENGEYPAEWETLHRLIRGICYDNAVRYFGFAL